MNNDYETVRMGIEEAVRDRKSITESVARTIASALHAGEDTAMYYFAETGGIMEEMLIEEIGQELQEHRLDEDEKLAARFLGLFALSHGDRPRQDGWEAV